MMDIVDMAIHPVVDKQASILITNKMLGNGLRVMEQERVCPLL
jgi:hypothetical protein